jgi:phosphoglycerate dehydrogenase-like enzyme
LLAAGYEKINLGLMREMNIPCCNNAGANSWAVADHTVLLMLALYRRLVLVDRSTRDGRWRGPINGLNTFEMAGKLIGIIGIGNIGGKVAKRVQAFDARVQYYDKYPLSKEREQQANVTFVPLEELIRTSDIITCHSPLTPETERMINAARLAEMKPSTVVINTSRGSVIDEAALIQALRDGRIAGAGLDVFEKEPVDSSNPLLQMDNVIVTAHSAGTTRDTWRRRAEFAFSNMALVMSGQTPMGLIQE